MTIDRRHDHDTPPFDPHEDGHRPPPASDEHRARCIAWIKAQLAAKKHPDEETTQ